MRATARGIMGSVFFAFDLDGTLTLDESFPLLGRELDADGSEEMARLTSAALDGMLTAEAIINELSNLKG